MNGHAGRIAGACALALVGLGPLSLMWIPSQTVVVGDPGATAALQVAREGLVRIGLVGELGIVVVELVMIAALHAMFASTQPALARLVATSRLAMTLVQAVTALAGFAALGAFVGDDLSVGSGLLGLRSAGVLAWQGLFGAHCAALAVAMFRSPDIPGWFGVGMVAAAVGYLLQGFGLLLLPGHGDVLASGLVVALMLGEVPFFLWLVIRRGGLAGTLAVST